MSKNQELTRKEIRSVIQEIRRKRECIPLLIDIIQNPELCLEGKGYYGMLEAGAIEWSEVPENIQRQLIKVGYVKEVANESK